MANKSYTAHVADLIGWILGVAKSVSSGPGSNANPTARKWCVLGLPAVDPASVGAYFDNSDVNAQYKAEYDRVTATNQLTNVPVAYLQQESDALYSLEKSFIARHTSRMQCYRDDCEQKNIRIHNLLQYTTAKYEHYKANA